MGHRGDREIEIVPFVGVQGDISLSTIICIVLIPLGLLFSIFIYLAEFLVDYFVVSSIVYFILAIGASMLLTKIKSISKAKLMDSISNFLMLTILYLFTYFYFVPQFFLRSAILSWLFSSAFIIFIFFLQQCFSRVISPVINLIVCSVIFVVAFIILRTSIDDSDISLDFLIRIYGMNENGFLRGFIRALLF